MKQVETVFEDVSMTVRGIAQESLQLSVLRILLHCLCNYTHGLTVRKWQMYYMLLKSKKPNFTSLYKLKDRDNLSAVILGGGNGGAPAET